MKKIVLGDSAYTEVNKLTSERDTKVADYIKMLFKKDRVITTVRIHTKNMMFEVETNEALNTKAIIVEAMKLIKDIDISEVQSIWIDKEIFGFFTISTYRYHLVKLNDMVLC